MPGRIRILDELTANRIAAGEVVERPASVVKELVENALDAGGRRVVVELREGGVEGVIVQDDGCGMAPEDVLLAVERHATSKIRSAEDLERVRTLGFRGEALPSIAAVARLEIVTREPAALAGTRLVVRGGRRLELAEAGCPAGTRVTVGELFFNTPARRKHLKSTAVELGHCSQVLTGLALAHTGVAFRARHNGRALLETPGGGHLLEAVAALYGRELAGQLLEVAGEAGGARVHGYVAPPAAARGSRSQQQFIVNGRPVVSGALRGAVEQAFRGLLPLHRYPVAILRLEMDPADLDVNIHPSKLQVRFAREAAVTRLVREAVERALGRADLTPRIPVARPGARGPAAASYDIRLEDAALVREAGAAYAAALRSVSRGDDPRRAPAPSGLAADGTEEGTVAPAPGSAAPAPAGGRWPDLRVVGQVAQSFVVAEGPGGIYIIDQHAAHERLKFEAFLARMAGGGAPGQVLAVPLSLHLGPREAALWEEHRGALERLGFRAEAFGGGTLLVREVPAIFAGEARDAFLRALDAADRPGAAWTGAADPRDQPGAAPGTPPAARSEAKPVALPAAPEWEYAYAALAACKASVKARDPLRPAEMEGLLARLGAAANPFTCPHGRPTLLRLEFSDLERHFKRA